jgi:Glycosyl transferase family 90
MRDWTMLLGAKFWLTRRANLVLAAGVQMGVETFLLLRVLILMKRLLFRNRTTNSHSHLEPETTLRTFPSPQHHPPTTRRCMRPTQYCPLLVSPLRHHYQQQQHRTTMTKNSSSDQLVPPPPSHHHHHWCLLTTSRSSRQLLWWRLIAFTIVGLALLIRYESLVQLSRALESEREENKNNQKKSSMEMTMRQKKSSKDDGGFEDCMTEDDSSVTDGIDINGGGSISNNSRKLSVCNTGGCGPAATATGPSNNSTVVVVKTIMSYLSLMHAPEDWVLLKWNPDGTFDHDRAQTTSQYAHWAPPPDTLGDAKPSAHGRVVLLLNSDRLPLVPWTVRPPVPVWVYSKPIAPLDPRNLPETLPERCELDRVAVVPSPYDRVIWNRYCVEVVDREVQRRTFAEKINKVMWRGAIHFRTVERSRVALLQYAQSHGDEETSQWLDVKEINKREDPDHMELSELAEYRYHIDMGGLSGTAWGGLRWKLCTGLLVFKVESWANDWWYDTLEPWTHYIPVREDVSDLHERYQWTQDNPEKAQEIAQAGRQRCLETLGEEKAKEQYQAAAQQVPAAEASVILEAEDMLEQMMRQKTDMRGIVTVAS